MSMYWPGDGQSRRIPIAGRMQPHRGQPVRMRIGQRTQQQRVHHAENGGIGADSNAQRSHNHHASARHSCEACARRTEDPAKRSASRPHREEFARRWYPMVTQDRGGQRRQVCKASFDIEVAGADFDVPINSRSLHKPLVALSPCQTRRASVYS